MKIIFFVLCILFLVFFPYSVRKKIVIVDSVVPIHLTIPQIKVNAEIKQVGVTSEGVMEVPRTISEVGWFKLGPRPGEKGSAVLAGHFNGKNGEDGVFVNLYQLKKGDKIYVKNNDKSSTTFVVKENRIYDPGYANEVFSRDNGIHLNLITCDGIWDGVKKSYNKRLVVFTSILRK